MKNGHSFIINNIVAIFILLILLYPHKSTAQIQQFNAINNNSIIVPKISVDSLKLLKKVWILDTRETNEFEVSHLKNAIHVGYLWFDMRDVYKINKSETIVLYCSVGYRSEKIGERLIKTGYKNVYNLAGGIFEWVNKGNPVYKKDGTQTTEVHTYNKKWSKSLKKGSKVF